MNNFRLIVLFTSMLANCAFISAMEVKQENKLRKLPEPILDDKEDHTIELKYDGGILANLTKEGREGKKLKSNAYSISFNEVQSENIKTQSAYEELFIKISFTTLYISL